MDRVHGRDPRGGMAGPIRLRDLRNKAGLSMRALAKRVGVSATYVSAVERGIMKASPQYLADVLQALDVKRPYRARVYWAFELIPPSITDFLMENRRFFNNCFDQAEPYDGALRYRTDDHREDPDDDPEFDNAIRTSFAERKQESAGPDVQPGGEAPMG